MHPRRIAILLLGLGLGWSTPSVSADPTLKLFMDHENQEQELPLTPDGLALARQRCENLFGPLYGWSNTWQTLLRLYDPGLQAQLRHVISTTRLPTVEVHLVPRDDPYSLFPGEVIQIPGNRRHTVAPMDNVLGLAVQYGTTMQEIERANPLRLRVWPMAMSTTVDGVEVDKGAYLGELGMHGETMQFRTAAWIDEVLVHEMGHAGDDSVCDQRDYGPDGRHDQQEILTPAIGFFEGWGVYQEAHVSAETRQKLESGLIDLKIESPTAGRYYSLERRDIGPWDLVSNERFVARVLWYAERMLGEAAVRDAFVATQGQGCRFLGDWWKQLRAQNPQADGLSGALMMLALVGENSTGGGPYESVNSAEDWALILDGQLAGGITRVDPPRPRQYQPSIPMIIIDGSDDEELEVAPAGTQASAGLLGL